VITVTTSIAAVARTLAERAPAILKELPAILREWPAILRERSVARTVSAAIRRRITVEEAQALLSVLGTTPGDPGSEQGSEEAARTDELPPGQSGRVLQAAPARRAASSQPPARTATSRKEPR
jgi:hypothetical protein